MAGNTNLCDFFSLFFTKNNLSPQVYQDYKNRAKKGDNFEAIVIFAKTDIHSVEDEIKEINRKFTKIPMMIVSESAKFFVIDSLYTLGVKKICFTFNPESVLEELNQLIGEDKNSENKKDSDNKNYTIQFHENNDAFMIDISGTLKQDKVKPLKLMFMDYLKNKIEKIKVVIYLFSGADEKSMTFINIWALLKIWQEIGINYNKIVFLTSSEIIKSQINKYFASYGIKHFENLLEIIKVYFPEMSKKDEAEIFEFSSKLLEAKK